MVTPLAHSSFYAGWQSRNQTLDNNTAKADTRILNIPRYQDMHRHTMYVIINKLECSDFHQWSSGSSIELYRLLKICNEENN